MATNDKRQFLDPLGAPCRFVLLKLEKPKTKIRIIDHTVQMVPDSYMENLYRQFYYGDSREDLQALYPAIVRFIELYLIPRREIVVPNFSPAIVHSNYVQPISQIKVQSTSEIKKSVTKVKKQKQQKPKKSSSDFDLFDEMDNDTGFGFGELGLPEEEAEFDENNASDEESITEQEEQLKEQPKKEIDLIELSVCPVTSSIPHSQSFDNNTKVYEALVSIAKNIMDGFKELQKTYKYGTVVLSLQLYINLLQAGMDGVYSRNLLPEHLRDLTSRNLLSDEKIKALWKDEDIIELGKLLKFCFESTDNKKGVGNASSYRRAAINSMLDERDEIFKNMIASTNHG